jgi:hypothetical protein
MNTLTILGFSIMFFGLILFLSLTTARKIEQTEHRND